MLLIVHKTQGKLDLRSIMTFGLNAKPKAEGHPIGYFGTGLKYALAILAREDIPVEIWIDKKKWTIEKEKSVFRDKVVYELYLVRHKKLLPPTRMKLPFTTDVGKNWTLWQAFRELHSNTLDEQGETFGGNHFEPTPKHTEIVVRGNEYVNEYLDREKTFLPEGLRVREGNDTIQVLDRPSKHIYYRGIRIVDLKEGQHSQLTYNILAPIELTEDRTAKSVYDVEWRVQNYIASMDKPEIASKVIQAHSNPKTFEGRMSFTYSDPSKAFLDAAEKSKETLPSDTANVLRAHRPPPKPQIDGNWLQKFIHYVEYEDWSEVIVIGRERKQEIVKILSGHIHDEDVAISMGTNEPDVQCNEEKEEEYDDNPF